MVSQVYYYPIQGAYCASKHAVKGFTDALRMELEHDGAPISVTLIKPSSIDTPYRQHAKNYMREEPRNPPPVYAPQPVAEAILYAAERPIRDVYVGGAGRALSVGAFVAPRLTDKAMDLQIFAAQKEDFPSASPHSGLDLALDAVVGTDELRLPAASQDAVLDRAAVLLGATRERHRGTLRRQHLDDPATDPACPARHQRDLAVEPHRHLPL